MLDQGLAHGLTMSYSRKPGAKSARFELSCITSHILMALQTINGSVFPCCFHTGIYVHTYIHTMISTVYKFIWSSQCIYIRPRKMIFLYLHDNFKTGYQKDLF
ncbi:hypothetical protein HanIR_Chr02g0058081 [Helianthus annuus]|nr:hypothetical protein HanIR_Chr02g0058081 [Helianthus annuus]